MISIEDHHCYLLLEYLLLTNGLAAKGGGIAMKDWVLVTAKDSVITGNRADLGGAFSVTSNTILVLDGTRVHANYATSGIDR